MSVCASLNREGFFLFSEATVRGWNNLNKMRREWDLNDIPMPGFNNYHDEQQVIEALRTKIDLVELVNFASTYYVGTRVLKPLSREGMRGRSRRCESERGMESMVVSFYPPGEIMARRSFLCFAKGEVTPRSSGVRFCRKLALSGGRMRCCLLCGECFSHQEWRCPHCDFKPPEYRWRSCDSLRIQLGSLSDSSPNILPNSRKSRRSIFGLGRATD